MMVAISLILIVLIAFISLICISNNITRSLKSVVTFSRFSNTGLPIVSLYNNNKQFNFIIDSGAFNSMLDKRVLDEFEYEKIDYSEQVYGLDGNTVDTEGVFIKLASPEFLLKDRFLVTDIPALDNILETDGIKVVGVLGSTFLKKNYLVIDYDALALSMYKK